jgi:hypothetical protein
MRGRVVVAAALAAAACSSADEGAVTDRAGATVAEATLSRSAPRVALDLPGGCGPGLIVRIGAQAGPDALLVTVAGIVAGTERRLAAYTPYPTGSAGTIRIPAGRCAGVERLIVEARPIRSGEALPAEPVRITIARLAG